MAGQSWLGLGSLDFRSHFALFGILQHLTEGVDVGEDLLVELDADGVDDCFNFVENARLLLLHPGNDALPAGYDGVDVVGTVQDLQFLLESAFLKLQHLPERLLFPFFILPLSMFVQPDERTYLHLRLG